jgi:hypothetical protein
MRSLKIPTFTLDNILKECIRIKKRSHHTRPIAEMLDKNRGLLIEKETEYLTKARAHNLFTFTIIASDNQTEIQKILIDLYRVTFVGSINIYHKLRLATSSCPYCDVGLVGSLDHYLPKTHYPDFSLTPMNLIPSCTDCNGKKKALAAPTQCDQVFHPYFDDLDEVTWLSAIIYDNNGITVKFEVRFNDNAVDPVLESKIINNFKIFKLAELYCAKASRDLQDHYHFHRDYAITEGAESLKVLLRQASESMDINFKNSWRGALYRALSESDWYCNEYFPNEAIKLLLISQIPHLYYRS